MKPNDYGVYHDPVEKIEWVLDLLKFELKANDNLIRICLLGDKTVSKRFKFFQLLFFYR